MKLDPVDYQHIPPFIVTRARLHFVQWVPGGRSGFTFGRHIWVRRDKYVSIRNPALRSLVAHELVHVQQFKRQGVIRFSYRYVSEYLKNRFDGEDHKTAYLNISAEKEARVLQKKWEQM